MSQPTPKKRPLASYLSILIALDALLVALVAAVGGFNLEVGPIHLQVQSMRGPALALLFLLVLRRAIGARSPGQTSGNQEGGKGEFSPWASRWQETFFGPTGSPTERWRAVEVLFVLMVVYALFIGGATQARHRHFESEAMSLGAAAQVAWNSAHGRTFASSLTGGGDWLGSHFSPVMLLVAQGYRIWPTVGFLINLQTIFLALGAWPVYIIARQKLQDRRWALALAVLYLAYPAVRGVNLSGFHPLSLAVAPLLFAWHLLDERRRWGGYIFLAFALLCGEEVWLAAAFMGLYLCVVRRRWREGLFLLLPSLYFFIFLVAYFMPKAAGVEALALSRYRHLGGTVVEVAAAVIFRPGETLSLLSDPVRMKYLQELFLPLAVLPLFAPLQLAVGLPLLLGNLLAGDHSFHSVRSPHAATVIPFIFASAAVGLRRARDGWALRRLNLFSGPLLRWALLLLPLLFLGSSPGLYFKGERPEGYGDRFAAVKAMIPPEASLSAENHLVPHLAHRQDLYLFPDVREAQFVLVELGRREGNIAVGEELREVIARLVREERYAISRWDESFLLLAREEGDRSPEAIQDLADQL